MKIYSCIIFLTLTINCYAQKKFNAQGSAQVKIENNMSKDMATSKAKNLAIINAIESVLGTYVEQETNINIEDGETNFKIIGNTKVKGEWIKTTKETYSENLTESKNAKGKGTTTDTWITCEIKGNVRELTKPKLAFEATSLNCPESICRTTTFYNDESFYLNFISPSSGYLSIYLEEDDIVYRLLPYSGMDNSYNDAIKVTADKSYIFFSQSQNHDYFPDFPINLVDELVMTTESTREYLKLFVVFSTESFAKPLLKDGLSLQQGSLPKSLSKIKFETWITENRIYNSSFNYEVINLEIIRR